VSTPKLNSTTIGKVKRQSLANQTADLLRQSIEAGVLFPGTRLIEADIASEMGISRGILREALRMLEQDNLVESFPGRGTYIITPSEREIQEIYSLRIILEAEAVRLATEKASEQDLEELRAIYDKMLEDAHIGDKTLVVEKDLEFHRKIWETAGHKCLRDVLEDMRVQIRLYLIVNIKLYEDLATDIADHEIILKGIQEHDPELATSVMTNHLQAAADLVTQFVRQNELEV
jgi:DNA-binding GntR family transcriptional regulator